MINTQLVIEIMIVAFVVIAFGIWVAWQIKKKGLKEFTIDMIIKAEDMYKKGENDQKFNYVLDKVIAMIPMPLQLFISEDLIKQFIQKTFDNLKKALNYQPKKEV